MTTADKLRQSLPTVFGERQDARLTAWLTTVATALDAAQTDYGQAVLQLDLKESASGDWLDLWGILFGVPRQYAGEPDSVYAARLINETIRQRPQRHALEAIVKDAFGITVVIADLWPYVLHSDADIHWTVPPGWPRQVSDGQLFGSPNDQAICGLGGIAQPYVPGVFGVWVYVSIIDPYTLSLAQAEALFPQFLLSDEFAAGTLHVSDGQLVTPASDARISFGFAGLIFHINDDELLALLNRHRAAGTMPVLMEHIAA